MVETVLRLWLPEADAPSRCDARNRPPDSADPTRIPEHRLSGAARNRESPRPEPSPDRQWLSSVAQIGWAIQNTPPGAG